MKLKSSFLPLGIVVLLITGCGASASVSIGGKVLDKSQVEQGASDALAKVVGQPPASIVCPGDLDAKVGATERCTLTDNEGNELGMSATVKSLDGDRVNYEVKVDK